MTAKLSPPASAHAVIRPKPLRLLEEMGERRLVIVCAPAGYGKTTLVTQALERSSWPHVWYKLDVLDQDPAVMLASLTHALRRTTPAFGAVLLDRLESAADIAFPAEEVAAEFVREAQEHLRTPLKIVLDDYHEATETGGLDRAVDYLLGALPPHITLLVMTRYEPALATARLRLDGQLGVIGPDHLRFDAAATAAACQTRGVELPAAHAERLAALTEGWPAAIVLASMALRWLDFDSIGDALADPRLKQDAYSYLAEQVYRKEPAATRRFLKRTCCLDTLTEELAARVSGASDARHQLQRLTRRQVFTFPTSEPGAYRYHGLFRDFLRSKCVQEDGEGSFRRLQLDAAAAVEQAGDVQLAVELCFSANEPELALGVIARAGETDLDNYRAETIETWLARLPASLAAHHPWAALLRAHLAMREGDFDDALAHTDRAEAAFEEADDRWGLYHALSVRETALFWSGQPLESWTACEQAVAAAVTPQQRVHSTLSMLAAAVDAQRWDLADGCKATVRAVQEELRSDEYERLRLLLAAELQWRGHLAEAATAYSALNPSLLRAVLRAAVLNCMALVRHGLAEYRRAEDSARQAVELAVVIGHSTMEALHGDTLGFITADIRGAPAGLAILEGARDALAAHADVGLHMSATMHVATIQRREGRLREALDLLRRIGGGEPPKALPSVGVNARANWLFAEGLAGGTVADEVRSTGANAADRGLLFVALKCSLFNAILAHVAGHTDAAVRELSDCVPTQLELGHLSLLGHELGLQPELALALLRDGLSAADAATLLDAVARHRCGAAVMVGALRCGDDTAIAAATAVTHHWTSAEARGFLRKAARTRSGRLKRHIATLLDGLGKAPPVAASRLGLTPREAQILGLMAAGKRNPDIAAELFLSPATVKTHINRIFAKLGVTDRVQAVLRYRTIQPPDGESV